MGILLRYLTKGAFVLCAAYVTERIIPGCVYADHGSKLDIVAERVDRGGSINPISPPLGVSKYCWGMATSGYLVEVQKLSGSEMAEWKKNNPKAFAKDYSPYYGIRTTNWIEGGSD